MKESISLYVTQETAQKIREIAKQRYGAKSQISAIVSEIVRLDILHSDDVEVDTHTSITYIASNTDYEILNVHYTQDEEKTTIRATLKQELVNYLRDSQNSIGYNIDYAMTRYVSLLKHIQNQDTVEEDEEDAEDEKDVNEYLLNTSKDELSVQEFDVHDVKQSAQYRVNYILALMNDNDAKRYNTDDIEQIITDTFNPSKPTIRRYTEQIMEDLNKDMQYIDTQLSDLLLDDSVGYVATCYSHSKQSEIQLVNFAYSLADAQNLADLNDVAEQYLETKSKIVSWEDSDAEKIEKYNALAHETVNTLEQMRETHTHTNQLNDAIDNLRDSHVLKTQ